jgi:hypothetical protein
LFSKQYGWLHKYKKKINNWKKKKSSALFDINFSLKKNIDIDFSEIKWL